MYNTDMVKMTSILLQPEKIFRQDADFDFEEKSVVWAYINAVPTVSLFFPTGCLYGLDAQFEDAKQSQSC